jgi:hypothetical protein
MAAAGPPLRPRIAALRIHDGLIYRGPGTLPLKAVTHYKDSK